MQGRRSDSTSIAPSLPPSSGVRLPPLPSPGSPWSSVHHWGVLAFSRILPTWTCTVCAFSLFFLPDFLLSAHVLRFTLWGGGVVFLSVTEVCSAVGWTTADGHVWVGFDFGAYERGCCKRSQGVCADTLPLLWVNHWVCGSYFSGELPQSLRRRPHAAPPRRCGSVRMAGDGDGVGLVFSCSILSRVVVSHCGLNVQFPHG